MPLININGVESDDADTHEYLECLLRKVTTVYMPYGCVTGDLRRALPNKYEIIHETRCYVRFEVKDVRLITLTRVYLKGAYGI
jgi:hypothetical protein